MSIKRLMWLMGVFVIVLAGCGGRATPASISRPAAELQPAAVQQPAATVPPTAVLRGGGPTGDEPTVAPLPTATPTAALTTTVCRC